MKFYMFVNTFALFLLKGEIFTIEINGGTLSQNSHDTCSTWGQGAIRTYTNAFYYFRSNCNYILSRHCQGDTEDFNLEIRRDPSGKLEHIFINIEGAFIVVANDTIKVKNNVITMPYIDKLVSIHRYGVDVRFINRKQTISIIWNYNDALSITVDVQYHGKLCGLCGLNDENIPTTYDLAFTLQANMDTSGTCTTVFPEETSCDTTDICSEIPKRFKSCSSDAMNNNFMRMCRLDSCACGGAPDCHCASFGKASQECTHVNPSIWKEWRNLHQCTRPTCPENQVYQECGPACMPTCTDPFSQQQCDQCINTCGCPAGTVLNNQRGNNSCIRPMDCPCEYDGTFYSSGEIRNSHCRSCTCRGGMWECTDLNCAATCSIEGGTHITTFDGTQYNLIGDCSYYAVVTQDWSVKIQIHPCQAAYKQTCLQQVAFIVNQNTYTINWNGIFNQNGNKIELPLRNGNIMIFQQSSHYIQVHAVSGLKMQIQIFPIMQLYISLPRSAEGSTKGLCGTFNANADDDFLSAYGMLENTYFTFADSWKVMEGCPLPNVNPTCVSSENEIFAKEHCAQLKNPVGDFAICHSTVEFNKYYEMCKVASCNCEKVTDCVCAIMGAYAHACAARGVIVRNWRGSVCRVNCPISQIYHHDMRACNRTCRFLSNPDFTCELQDVPVAGCGCPQGKYMNDENACVSRSECPCYVDGLNLPPGQSLTLNGMTCLCLNGELSCPNARNPPILQDCKKQSKIFSNCSTAGACKRTCETLYKPCPNPCVPGCVCPDGLVEDSSGRCVTLSQCPCVFGGETFGPGEKIKRDCNKCTCKSGTWECSNDPCPKTCQVYGDGHYMTFDGKRYTFDGNCEYIFVEDRCLREIGTFQILTESIPCCENGVTCSRNIRIIFEDKEIILLSGNRVSETSLGKNQCTENLYTIHNVGLYLVITFPNGITVIWDKRTRFSITLDPRWKNKVCGLCGNFNENIEDDLTTKGNSLVTSFTAFGNSWKSIQSCSNTVNEIYPCDNNPYCLTWAQKRCSIITGPVFQACHKMVNPILFYDACVQEACACDMEGKYQGLCTAIAVYAEACNKAEVCIRWRTPEFCPVYCDYYNSLGGCSWHYQPCGTTTTRTCTGHFIGKKFSAILEGCYAKCPDTAPYLDENIMKCVTLNQCTCYYDGRILQHGERTMSDCEECTCNHGITTCKRITTTTVPSTTLLTTTPLMSTSTISSPITIPEETSTVTSTSISSTTGPHCFGVWTRWYNEHHPTTSNPHDYELFALYGTPLCPSASDTITNIECQVAADPYSPLSISTEAVICNKDVGLTCTHSGYALGQLCRDYRIRVCCEPSPSTISTTESTTTSTTEETTTTVTPSTTTSTTETTTTESTTSPTTEETTTMVTPSTTTSSTEETTTTTTEATTTESTTSPTTEKTTTTATTTTESTTSPTTEETSTVTSTSISSTTGPHCFGVWTRWYNEHHPTTSNPHDYELFALYGTPLCPSASDTITNIECQVAADPYSPLSISTEAVICNKDVGLTCTHSGYALGQLCRDYRIRVCCEPSPSTISTTESTTTSTTEETTTTVTPSTTTSTTATTTTESTASPTTETSPITSTTKSTTTSTTEETTTMVTPSTTTSSTEETTTTTTEATTTESTTSPTTEKTTTTATTTTESTTSPTTEETSTVTSTSISSTTGPHCFGVWTRWYNEHHPTTSNPHDYELFALYGTPLCPSASDTITNIECQVAADPYSPLSISTEAVICNKDVGLTCTHSGYALGQLCRDYRIRVCCEPSPSTISTTESTTTSTTEETTTTVTPSTTTSTTATTTTESTASPTTETSPITSTTKSTTTSTTEETTTMVTPSTTTSSTGE
ncbi:mucin-6-like [Rhinoraja longicauda]